MNFFLGDRDRAGDGNHVPSLRPDGFSGKRGFLPAGTHFGRQRIFIGKPSSRRRGFSLPHRPRKNSIPTALARGASDAANSKCLLLWEMGSPCPALAKGKV
jgi:hypothetical protein